MIKALESLEKHFLYLVVFLVPVAVLGIFANPFEVPKVAILIFGAIFLLFTFSLSALLKGTVSFSLSNFDLPVALLAVTYLAAAIIKTPNKMEAFLVPGIASVVLAGSLIYFLLNQSGEVKKAINVLLTLSGVLVSLVSLLSYSGALAKLAFLPNYAKSVYFNLAGGYLPQLLMLGVIIPLAIGLVLKEKEAVKKLFFGVCLLIIIAGGALSLYNILPGKPGEVRLPSFNTSWQIAVEALKTSPFLGVGPANYLTAFNRLRPIAYNQTDLWGIKFPIASSFFLTHLTETGLLGLLAFGILIWQVVKIGRRHENVFSLTSLVLSLMSLLLLPGTTVLIFAFFVLLALNSRPSEKKLNLTLLTLPLLILALALAYLAGRGFLAEYKYKKAIVDLKDISENITAAVRLNPYVDRYHASYSLLSLQNARVLADNTTGEGKTLTDEDRNTIAALIQQAIREAKATAALNPGRSQNWEILARTYQAIMPFAKGADQFAIQTFSQAVALDPLNPNLRIALGGVYYALGNYDEAIKVFAIAVAVKNDLANAHYNLSAAYREKGEIKLAIDEMNIVLGLVEKDSPDFELATGELTALQKRLPTLETGGTNNLTPPLPAEEPVITPPLELPEDSNPPASE